MRLLAGHPRLRLHAGTVCCVLTPGKPYDQLRCELLAFKPSKAKWHVRLQGSGKEVLVSDASLRLSYCILPSSVGRHVCNVKLELEEDQGTCGRGLVTRDRVHAGTILFEEPPFMISYRHPADPRRHHEDRWLAYEALIKAANRNDSGASTALAAFEALGFADHALGHIAEVVDGIAGRASDDISPQVVTAALMRFHCNQFIFPNNGGDTCDAGDERFGANALYSFISRVNHSCDPAIAFVKRDLYCRAHKVPYNFEEHGGVIMAYAKREIQPGERLTFSYTTDYGPDASYIERRAFLRERFGFVCGCERCVAEEEADPARCLPAVEGGADAGSAVAPAAATSDADAKARTTPSTEHVQQSSIPRTAQEGQTAVGVATMSRAVVAGLGMVVLFAAVTMAARRKWRS